MPRRRNRRRCQAYTTPFFFKDAVNYRDDGARVTVHGDATQRVRAAADNDYKTFTTETDLDISLAVDGNPTRVDAVFLKSKGVTQHSGTPSGGTGTGWTNVALPATVKNWEGTDVSTTVAGFQHHLYLLPAHFTATSVRLQLQGASVQLYEVMLLEFGGIEADANGDFIDINANYIDRRGKTDETEGDTLSYRSPLLSGRDRWAIDYAMKVQQGKTLIQTPEEFLYWRSDNKNFVHAMEWTRHPARVFPAVFVRRSIPIRYRTDNKNSGEIVGFRVEER